MIRRVLSNPKTWFWVHLILTCIWVGMIIPTLIFWPESIMWVAFMSVWANVAGHFGAMQSTRAEIESDLRAVHVKLDAIIAAMENVPNSLMGLELKKRKEIEEERTKVRNNAP